MCDRESCCSRRSSPSSPFPTPKKSEISLVEDVQRGRLQPVLRNLCLGFYSFSARTVYFFFNIHIYIYVYTYIKFDDEAGFSIFCSFVLFSHHHPDSLAFPSLGERRGSSPSCLGVMFPRGDRGGLLLSDLFAILNKLLTEVTIFAFSEECRFFALFFFPWGL